MTRVRRRERSGVSGKSGTSSCITASLSSAGVPSGSSTWARHPEPSMASSNAMRTMRSLSAGNFIMPPDLVGISRSGSAGRRASQVSTTLSMDIFCLSLVWGVSEGDMPSKVIDVSVYVKALSTTIRPPAPP